MEDAGAQRRARRDSQVRLAWFALAAFGAVVTPQLLFYMVVTPVAAPRPTRRGPA